MINGIENLSIKDKLFMIYNKQLFSLPTRATINFNSKKWLEEINGRISENEIEYEKNHLNNLISECYSLINGSFIGDDVQIDNIHHFINRLFELAFETKEDICEFFVYVNMLLMYNGSISNLIYNTIFTKIIPYKLNAFEIFTKMQNNDIPADNELYEFSMKTLRHLFNLLVTSESIDLDAFIIYMITTELPLEKRVKNPYEIFINAKASLNKLNNEETGKLKELCIKLDKGDTDSLSIIDSIRCDDTGFKKYIIDRGEISMRSNFNKKLIADPSSSRIVAIGDDVLPEGIDLNNLIVEIEKLQPDNLKNYIGELNQINYEIPEKDIGYFKVREKSPICKIVYNDRFYTVIKHNDISYLLFNIIGKSQCYGISFPCGVQGSRNLISFDIPDILNYKLEI